MRGISEKAVIILVDTISTIGVSPRTPLPAALLAALTELLGSYSAEIHSTHTDLPTMVSCILYMPLLMAELAPCVDQHDSTNSNTVLYHHWTLASQHPACNALFSLNFQ